MPELGQDTCPACKHPRAEHVGRWCRVPTGAVNAEGQALICCCEAVEADTRTAPTIVNDPASEPAVFTLSGKRVGPNPAYDPNTVRVETFDFGPDGITRHTRWVSAAHWSRDIVFDPGPERELQEGSRIHIPSMGDDFVLVVDHVADPDDDGVVQLTVHSEPRET